MISIEVDAKQQEIDWRPDFVRGIQVVQWTILSKPGHPVLLDVLGRALGTARRVRKAREDGSDKEVPSPVR